MKYSFKVSIITLVLTMVTTLTVLITLSFIFISSELSEETARTLFESHSIRAQDTSESLFRSGLELAILGAKAPAPESLLTDEENSEIVPLLLQSMRNSSELYSLYYGFQSGEFYQIIATRASATINSNLKAPSETFWAFRSIKKSTETESGFLEHWKFFSKSLKEIGTTEVKSPTYDPRDRVWFKKAMEYGDTVLSEPYTYDSLQEAGITASRRTRHNNAIFGVDLTLSELQHKISKTQLSPNGGIIIFDDNNRVLAMSSNLGKYPPLTKLDEISNPKLETLTDGLPGLIARKLSSLKGTEDTYFAFPDVLLLGALKLNIIAISPTSDFTEKFNNFYVRILQISLVVLALFLPLIYWFSSRLSHKVTELSLQARRIEKMDFGVTTGQSSSIIEFDRLIRSFNHMSKSLFQKTQALKIEQERLSRLVELGIAMSSEKDSDKLMEMVLLGAKELTNSDGGSLYSINDENLLQFELVQNDTLGIHYGGTGETNLDLPVVPLFNEDGTPNHANVVSYAVNEEITVNIDDVYNASEFDFSGMREVDANFNYTSKSFLTIPLKPRGGDVIGALQLINAKDPKTGEIIPFDDVVRPFVEALAAQAATCLYNRELLKAQDALMDSLIQLIAGAIDAKSLYTGGHCERVPELAFMLVREAEASTVGELADFRFHSPEERREFQIGAWLHDCGKVITPEFVVDKATKLETIYNRIHEIRTRFEVVLRDAEIRQLKATLDGLDPKKAAQNYESEKEKLLDDYAFVAECNIGGEFMSDDKIERIKEIGEIEWTRNFDIKLGLAHQEAPRYANEPATPALQKLLDDRDSHIIPRDRDIAEIYNSYDFKLNIPKHVYNQGEIHNLTIQRGTLTDEERFKINEHIMQTIVMLEQIPLPKHLKRVPEYAGTHHETMIGTGYPRKLKAEDLSIPSRIMAIADIFEALTASDRPYKEPKTLSESVKILSFFKKDQHIDPVLFDLFLTSGVYLKYAKRFLKPEQIDEVDIEPYLG